MKRILLTALVLPLLSSVARVEFTRPFSPADAWVKPQERPFRDALCLNGAWQFQPVAVPAGFKRDAGTPPDLPPPATSAWAATPIRIPSPWNVNTWGCGRDVGAGTANPYWPDSVYFPSYPAEWDRAEMGWLRRTFRVPADWKGNRLALHLEAVAGEAQVFVNGRPAGTHFDAYLPFEVDVTDLVRRDGDNELLVGVRARALFNRQSATYPKMHAPYPTGSDTAHLAGLWQDVYLLARPALHVADVFAKPRVDADLLELDVTIRNDEATAKTIRIGADILPWLNRAGTNVLDAPEPNGTTGPAALALPQTAIAVSAGSSTTVTLRAKVAGRLKTWEPGAPNLYAAVVNVEDGGRVADRRFTRFGWRQFSFAGPDLLLNGRPLKLTGDFLHPFGPFVLSRRYVWAWYRMIQDFGGNAVRPHAQPHPRHYLDLADEMGLVVLDETALFGSSIALNFEDPAAWPRFEQHLDALVLRDRNHPSVVGWSFGNELFAIFEHNHVPDDVAADWYGKLTALGRRALTLDPTRPWISCDGDEDLRGTLPVWSKHFGHGTPLDRLPAATNKPLMVGESGGTYYARPAQLAVFNGPRAFESYAGRNEALAIDAYDNLVRMAQPRLAYFSASETAWFGIEHLNFGYRDFTRLPGREDGVFFARPVADGEPGFQPERLPPYVATLNPGWDPVLPLYKPLAMFEAQKAALTKGGSQSTPWKRADKPAARPQAPVGAIDNATFIGDRAGPVARRLASLGVVFSESATGSFVVVDGSGSADVLPRALQTARDGGTALVLLGARDAGTVDGTLRVTERAATMLAPEVPHAATAGLALPDLYFAEDGPDRFIVRRGLAGSLVDSGHVLLRASDTDWSLFNNAPEKAKCAAVLLHERMQKEPGAALVECASGPGRVVLCTLDPRVATRPATALWRHVLGGLGLKLGEAREGAVSAFDEQNALVNALATTRFGAPSLDAALTTDFIGEAAALPATNAATAWRQVTSPSRDRFVLREMKSSGPAEGAFAQYIGFWIRSPRGLDDLLADGPDAPRFTLIGYVAERARLFVNGREIAATRNAPADYRTRSVYERVPLQKGWNRIVFKIAATKLDGDQPATLAVRMEASDPAFLRALETAVECGK